MISNPVRVVPWYYLGRQTLSADGINTATLPQDTTIISLTAETDVVRYAINGNADANSTPVTAGKTVVLGPLTNLASFSVFTTGGSVAHLEYWREV